MSDEKYLKWNEKPEELAFFCPVLSSMWASIALRRLNHVVYCHTLRTGRSSSETRICQLLNHSNFCPLSPAQKEAKGGVCNIFGPSIGKAPPKRVAWCITLQDKYIPMLIHSRRLYYKLVCGASVPFFCINNLLFTVLKTAVSQK